MPDLTPLIRGVGFQIHHFGRDRRDLTELFYADGIHDSLCLPGGPPYSPLRPAQADRLRQDRRA